MANICAYFELAQIQNAVFEVPERAVFDFRAVGGGGAWVFVGAEFVEFCEGEVTQVGVHELLGDVVGLWFGCDLGHVLGGVFDDFRETSDV